MPATSSQAVGSSGLAPEHTTPWRMWSPVNLVIVATTPLVPASTFFALIDPRRDLVDHPVVAERQDEQVLAGDAGDDEMPR
jgi:hypothetical protein